MNSSRIRECQYCGTLYELCMGCDQSNFFSWKQVACSIECYQEIEKIAMGICVYEETDTNNISNIVKTVDTEIKK